MLGLSLPVLILILGLGLCCLALIAIILLLHTRYAAARRLSQTGGDLLQKAYFEIKSSLNKTISERHPFRHSAADFTNSLSQKFHIEKLAIYISGHNRFAPVIWHNIDLPGINRLYFAAGSELVKKLTQSRLPVWFEKEQPGDNLGRLLFEKLDLKAAFPLIFGKQLLGMVIISASKTYRLEDLGGYLLSLTDQLAFAFQLSKRPAAPSSKYEKATRSSAPPSAEQPPPQRWPDYAALLESNTGLLKIYNEPQLYNSVLAAMEKHFQPAFAVLFLADQGGSLKARYYGERTPVQLRSLELRQGDALIEILAREHGIHRVQHIQEVLGVSPTMQTLAESGCRIIASFQMPQRQLGFLVMGEKSGPGGDYSGEELTSIATLCQTLRLTLDNIHQFKKIEELSYTDSMTGMYNYRYFYKRLGEEILRARRFERNLALVLFDIDEFKIINDSYGHQTGDHILKQLGMLIHNSVRSIDIVSRYGGEEFCVIMPETNGEACEQSMERLRIKISEFEFRDRSGKKSLNIRVSLGGAIFPADAGRIDRLIYCADMALLESKKSGRNKVCLYNPAIRSEADQA